MNRIETLALTIDRQAFQADYHNLGLSVSQVAEKHHISVYSISRLARRLGIPGRNGKATYQTRQRQPRSLGAGGCNKHCPSWQECNADHPAILPCEIYVYLDENPAKVDSSEKTIHGAINLAHLISLQIEEL